MFNLQQIIFATRLHELFIYFCCYLVNDILANSSKHIKSILITVAGLFIALHQVIPHHHHYNSPYDADSQEACPVEGDHENSLPENPDNHCHTLNELISDIKSGKQIEVLQSDLLFPANVISGSGFHLNSILLIFKESSAYVPKQLYLITDSPLRAPPYFS
jgi:hypothetical protein